MGMKLYKIYLKRVDVYVKSVLDQTYYFQLRFSRSRIHNYGNFIWKG